MARLKYRGEEIEVEFSIYGEYIPQTRWQPAEYPEYNIEDVFYNGTSIFAILSENDLEEINENLIAELE
jgi:hypothetical protein